MEDGRIEAGTASRSWIKPVENSDWEYQTNAQSTGWKNQNDDRVEYQRQGGNVVLELDADNKVDEIYQLLPTKG